MIKRLFKVILAFLGILLIIPMLLIAGVCIGPMSIYATIKYIITGKDCTEEIFFLLDLVINIAGKLTE